MKYKTADDRLIRVGDAYEYWKNKADTVPKFNDAKILRNMLDEVPPAEPEIIHCRDCKHYDGRPCGIVSYYNTDSDYCSRAERRKV